MAAIKEWYCKQCGYIGDYDSFENHTCPKCNTRSQYIPANQIENYKKYQAQKAEEERIKAENANKPVTCPKCGSTSIQAVSKGFGLLRGFVGSGKIENYCLNCGHKWNPKK